MIVPLTYYQSQNAKQLAPLLLGKIICCEQDGVIHKASITETECYYGTEDTACHAHKGKTPRTSVMFEQGGIAYVYLCYGIHHLLNIVTGEKDHPEAVLIRGVEGLSGPGKLTKALHIDRRFNGKSLTKESGLWLEDEGISPLWTTAPRIGIGYALEEDQQRLWRFMVK